MRTKRSLAWLLLAAMLITCSACSSGESANTPADTTAAPAIQTEAQTEPEPETEPEYKYEDILPKLDFKGAKYNVIANMNANMGALADYEWVATELTGEVVNDAVYNRNLAVENSYNVKIGILRTKTAKDDVTKAQAAGDAAYQCVSDGWANAANLVCAGVLRDWNRMEYIDISKPWYFQAIRTGTAINGRVYLEMNYTPFTGLLYTHCIFFNKQAVKDNKLQSPYELVDSGKWTIDTLASYVKDMNRDVNGDGKFDENDYFGYMTSYGSALVFNYAFNNPTVTIGKDNKITLAMNTQRFSDSVDKVIKLTYSSSSYLVANSKEADLAKMFASKHSLLYAGFISDTLLYFREMEDDYGMLIYPKFDETQERYCTKVGGGSYVLGIPALCGDAKLTGAVTEALAIESYRTIRPAVYEVSLSKKALRDEESYESYKLIMDNIILDFGQLFRMGKNEYINLLQTCVQNGENTAASLHATLEPTYQKHYQDIVDTIVGLPQ